MATETSAETANTSTEETSAQEEETNQDNQQGTNAETAEDSTTQEPSANQDVLPDSHPLVKAYAAQKEELKALRQSGQQVIELQKELDLAKASAQEATAVQAKYARLEEFLTQVGGPLSKALDSKSFTTALFETDTDISELVTKWHKDNPSATSQALNSSAGTTLSSKDMNTLLRTAAR